MSIIKLDESLLIAKGGERACYLYPTDDKKIIKILYTEGTHNNQNRLEYIYMNYLKRKKTDLSHITDCYGYIMTTLGKGLVYERVFDYDNKPSKSFRYMIAHKLIDEKEQNRLLNELKQYLDKNKILFIDNSMTNIFYKKTSLNSAKLVIVDGLGAKRIGFKFYLYLYLPFYRNYKIKKQWQKLMWLYNKDITRIKNNTMPMHRL
ncbi:YrbL family protein [Malaciobacter mytili]|uniref:YrbL family protein n=1 Tax=Malaciobacter mytili TaxID=603050 RepID=UPI003BB019C3